MADAQRDLKIVISSDTADAEKGIGSFGGALGDIGRIAAGIGLERLTEQFISLGKSVIEGSIKAFEQSQQVTAQLDTVLRSTNDAVGLTKNQLIELSKSLEAQTTASDEAVLSTENMLLTFTKIGKEIFPQTTKTVLDMATAMNGGITPSMEQLRSTSIQVGKALQDPILGVTALRRVGVNFNEEQQKMIKGLVESGKSMEAQRFILAELNKEFGGSAAAAASTYQGKILQLKNTWDDIQEVIGRTIVTAIYPFIAAIQPIITTVLQIVEGKRSWVDVINQLKVTFPQLQLAIAAVLALINNVFVPLFNYLKQIYDEHRETILLLAKALGAVLVAGIVAAVTIFSALLTIIARVIEIVLTLIETVGGVFAVAIQKGQLVVNGFGKAFQSLEGIVKSAMDGVTGAVKGMVDGAVDALNGLIDAFNKASKSVSGGKLSIPNIPKKALGGYGSGLTLVGENGPELVNLPSGSYVNTAKQTAGMGGGINITINNPSVRSDNDIKEIINQVKQALGRQTELARVGVY